jgi:hypothetical protein
LKGAAAERTGSFSHAVLVELLRQDQRLRLDDYITPRVFAKSR